MAEISQSDKRSCLQREIKMRRRVYPRWVETGKMKQADADQEIAVMEAILADYAPEPPADLFTNTMEKNR